MTSGFVGNTWVDIEPMLRTYFENICPYETLMQVEI